MAPPRIRRAGSLPSGGAGDLHLRLHLSRREGVTTGYRQKPRRMNSRESDDRQPKVPTSAGLRRDRAPFLLAPTHEDTQVPRLPPGLPTYRFSSVPLTDPAPLAMRPTPQRTSL